MVFVRDRVMVAHGAGLAKPLLDARSLEWLLAAVRAMTRGQAHRLAG